ncbi:hypothetical protein KIN20_004835 [Parelaphostrongylus tenuis]|uniref:Uncharacterized protein n=1 Tax=Parelaphostrongylus tenuis TaxID=148309 RepID=A0AAD5MRY7_PARTN|nr:hypothetical protein KIN20_004835 [Parelaphostrongylus tenuis]
MRGGEQVIHSTPPNDITTTKCDTSEIPFLQNEKRTVPDIIVSTNYDDGIDAMHVAIVPSPSSTSTPAIKCNLEEILKAPSQRQSVKDLREGQKMGHFTRQMIYKRTEKEWKSIPKSYPIAPPRP